MLTIDWKPNKNSKTPIYIQIENFIKDRIANGHWTVGSKLPTQRELSKIFDVNRSTIVQALDELKSEGLIEGKSSGGTVIINNTWSLLASTPPPNWENYIEGGIHHPNLATIQTINKLEFDEKIIRLGTGELSPELYPKDMMKIVLNNTAEKVHSLGYEEPKGSLHLRKEISKYVEKFGIKAPPSSILIVSGSLQALQLISMSVIHPGSTVLVEKPSYLKSLHIFQSSGMRLKGISMDSKGVKINEINNSINKSTAMLYTIPTLHNPTGVTMPEDRRRELLAVCEKNKLPIIEDDAYRELWLDEEPPMPLKSKDKNGIVLYLGTVSKSLAAGMRIGWVIGPEPVIERLGDIKMQTDYGASSISQWVLTEWLSSGLYEKYIKELKEELRIRRKIALEILSENYYDIATWNTPSGGFYIWLKIKKQISMEKLFSLACSQGILLNPGNIYDFSKNQNLRISYSYASLDDLKYGLIKLSEIIKAL